MPLAPRNIAQESQKPLADAAFAARLVWGRRGQKPLASTASCDVIDVKWTSDLLDAVGKVIKLEDRVTRLDTSVGARTDRLFDTRDRVIRLEGLIEGAFRSRAATSDRKSLLKPRA